jgi:hypothetical protein
MSFETLVLLLGVSAIIVVVAILFLRDVLLDALDTEFDPADNHTIPFKNSQEIALATAEGRAAIHHAACVDCIWRHQNTTHSGIAFCRGCSYFEFDQTLPNKAISERDFGMKG